MKPVQQQWNFDSPIWALGFRPFFLLGSMSGLVLMSIWISFQTLFIPAIPYFQPASWHAHEMIFGFCSAIIAGFLLTASQNWTGVPGVRHARLFTLVMIWLGGRLGAQVWPHPNVVYALVDLAFFPALGWMLWPYLGRPEQKNNRVFYLAFLLLFVGNLLIHLEALKFTTETEPTGIRLGINGVLLVVVLIGGRVLPFFAGRALPTAHIKTTLWVEKTIVPLTCGFAVLESLFTNHVWLAPLALLMAAAHGWRWWQWGPWQTRTQPILWVLYVAYFFLILGFFLQALSCWELIMPSVATHAFTVGGFSLIMLGMMSRVSLGHTGRPIQSTPIIVAAYVILLCAAVIRILIPIVAVQFYREAITISGLMFVTAFGIFLVKYLPILWLPRVDGRPG
ncbi:MAG: NnrS family protein [Bdellovibrionales bacterium]|nr:NnrS family protein [Bdellovibrionales bacterium]